MKLVSLPMHKDKLLKSVSAFGCLFTLSCGEFDRSSNTSDVERGEVKPETIKSGLKPTDGFNTETTSISNSQIQLPLGSVIPTVPAIACVKVRSNRALVTRVTQDVVNRSPTTEELSKVESPSFRYEDWVSSFVESSAMEDGYTKFITNLFRLDGIEPQDANSAEQVQLANDLKQEPVTLILKNKTKPWPWFWKTKTFYCNERTAPLYGLTRIGTPSFVECELPDERAGLLGLVSTLRASSSLNNPQAFYRENNNYGRAKNFIYWTKGLKLQANTSGPKGSDDIIPLASCVPTTDMRIKKNQDGSPGLIFGTASVPLSGSTCSGCHSKYNAPLSIAFRRFDPNGALLDLASIDKLNNENTGGFSKDLLKRILTEQNSCYAVDPEAPPQPFVGLVGLSEIAARNPMFGQALGVQVPELLSNTTADANMSATIAKSYYEDGQTLKAAFKGLFLSDSYRCEIKK